MPGEIANKIKQLRAMHHLTLEDVATHVGVGKSTVRKWETGQIANMRRDKIGKLAEALHTTPTYLMGWAEDDSKAEMPAITEDDDQNVVNIVGPDESITVTNLTSDQFSALSVMIGQLPGVEISRCSPGGFNKLAQGMNMTVAELFHAVDDMPVDLSSMTILTPTDEKLLEKFNTLNDIGQNLVLNYMDHMLAVDMYRKEPQVGTATAGHTGDVQLVFGKDGPVAVPRPNNTLQVASPHIPPSETAEDDKVLK